MPQPSNSWSSSSGGAKSEGDSPIDDHPLVLDGIVKLIIIFIRDELEHSPYLQRRVEHQ